MPENFAGTFRHVNCDQKSWIKSFRVLKPANR